MTARAAHAHWSAAGATGEGGSCRLLPFFCCFNVFVVETVLVDFIAVFSLSFVACCLLPRFPAMSSVEGFSDPEDPCAGEEFVEKLEIPPGLLPTLSAFSSDEAPALGSQSAAFRRETKAEEVDAVFGKSALERWSDAQDELLEKVFGFSGTAVPPSPAERYYRAWQSPGCCRRSDGCAGASHQV
jgi:hypothetical protein